uniref:VOC family protein n=1 Tax=Pararhizobium sp. IMCC3301 TaxID=3067904 RepID=UPI002740E6D4|nr:VOC family protein [Pararhizobium sp. IMCC3301]
MSELTMTTPGNAGWIGHAGPDSAAAMKFYRDTIGWTIGDLPMQDGTSYPAIMIGQQPIGGFSPMPQSQGAWTIFVTVDDVDACVERAQKAGGTIVSEPADMPGVGRVSTIADPQGAQIALITYESMQK